jgi:predicted RNA-binding protein YlxR (DUF448 family)
MAKKLPTRMCVACREMKQKEDLFRFVKTQENKVQLDPTFKAQGRGAYLCKNDDCVKKCVKHKLLNRAFRTSVPQEVYDKIMQKE